MLAWPGTLNMLSIIVQGMGLQYISASVSQMISGDSDVCASPGHACCASQKLKQTLACGRFLHHLHCRTVSDGARAAFELASYHRCVAVRTSSSPQTMPLI